MTVDIGIIQPQIKECWRYWKMEEARKDTPWAKQGPFNTLIKELTSQQKKCGNGPMLMELTGLTIFPTILKQLV